MSKQKKVGKTSKAKIIAVIVIAIFCAATIYAAAAYTSTVTINVDGIETRVTTFKTDANEIIKQAGIEVKANDVVDLSGFESGSDSVIRINRAYSITIFDNSTEGVKCTGNGTVTEALAQNNISLGEDDVINCNKNDIIYEGMKIEITRAFPVTITADGEDVTINIAGGTVSDALDKAVITVDDDDKISVPLDTPLTSGMKIKITHISYVERVEKEEVAFKTVNRNDSSMTEGQTKVITAGVKGEKEVTYRDKYVDGKLKESIAIKTILTKAAVDEVKAVGTKKIATTKPATTKASTTKVSTTKAAATTTRPATTAATTQSSSSSSPRIYSASQFRNAGVVYWNGYRWTWYSQRVLPGPGLNIPGRHVDENGYVCDSNNYICLASSTLRKGTVVNTPFGKPGKVYDSGCAAGTLDVYTNF